MMYTIYVILQVMPEPAQAACHCPSAVPTTCMCTAQRIALTKMGGGGRHPCSVQLHPSEIKSPLCVCAHRTAADSKPCVHHHHHTAADSKPSPCSFGLSATSQQYFSLRTNQPSATSQQYLRCVVHHYLQ
jgi:hypothetical protein